MNTILIYFQCIISIGKLRLRSDSSLIVKKNVEIQHKPEVFVKKEKIDAAYERTEFVKPENIVKVAKNGHSLVMVKRTRVKGFCVECIKDKKDPQYKSNLEKIITHCPKCPGGSWICEACFDRKHADV